MREIISLHVGQAGIQIGEACWELYCAEHSVLPDGTRDPFGPDNAKPSLPPSPVTTAATTPSQGSSPRFREHTFCSSQPPRSPAAAVLDAQNPRVLPWVTTLENTLPGDPTPPIHLPPGPLGGMRCADEFVDVFFWESDTGRTLPRALLIDTEPSVIDAVRNSAALGQLFRSDQSSVSGFEDAANNFARGYYGSGRLALLPTLEKIRCLVQDCDSFQGFLIFNAVGGGTGSGFNSLLLSHLSDTYAKRSRVCFCTWPSPRISTSVVEPYNAVLATHYLLSEADVTVILDNEALYAICDARLGAGAAAECSARAPAYKNLNRLISQAVSSTTASLRFQGTLNVDLNEIQTNLIPFPRLRFAFCSYAPLFFRHQGAHATVPVSRLTTAAFAPENRFVKCDIHSGQFIACCMLYRGDVTPNDAYNALAAVRSTEPELPTRVTNEASAVSAPPPRIRFVDWCPTGFKCGITLRSPVVPPHAELAPTSRSVCMLANSTAVREVFTRVRNKFDTMYARRAFVHWYIGEGMEESEFAEACEDLAVLERDYLDIGDSRCH